MFNYINNKDYSNFKLPDFVTINNTKYSFDNFIYLVAKTIVKIYDDDFTNVNLVSVNKSPNSYGDPICGNVNGANIVSLAKTVVNCVESKHILPNNLTSPFASSKIESNLYTLKFLELLNYYQANKTFNHAFSLESRIFHEDNHKGIPVKDIVESAKVVSEYYKTKKKYPNTIKVGNFKYTMSQFDYLVVKTISKIYNLSSNNYGNNYSKYGSITPINVKNPIKSTGNWVSINLNGIAKYMKFMDSIGSNLKINKAAPNSISIYDNNVLFKVEYNIYTGKLLEIINYHNKNGKFQNNLKISSAEFNSKSISISKILSISKKFAKYYKTNLEFPSKVTIDNVNFSRDTFIYLMLKSFVNIKNNVSGSIKLIDIQSRNYKSSLAFENFKYSIKTATKYANYLLNNLTSNKVLPKNIVINSNTTTNTDLFIYTIANTLSYYKTYKKLPSSISFAAIELFIDLNQIKKGVNQKVTLSNKDKIKYLKTNGKCAITKSIKNLAIKLTKNCKTNLQKALKLFDWVYDAIDYSYYYNTKYGSKKTLKYKKGNCCDQANLIIALARAAGIPARYVHGTAKFRISEHVLGHVWTQVYVDGYWCCFDTCCTLNKFGHIDGWNYKTYKLHGTYQFLPF